MATTHRLPTPGGDNNAWGDILNDFLAQSHNADGTLANGVVGASQLQNNSITDSHVASSAAIAKAKLAGSVQASLTAADNAVTRWTGSASAVAALPFINVMDYGAVGDGTANDAAAVQAAITAAAAAKRSLYLPAGRTFLVTGGLTVADGTADFTIYSEGTGAILKLSGTAGTILTIGGASSSRIRIANVQFNGGAVGLQVNGNIDGIHENLYFTGQNTSGIVIQGDNATEQTYRSIVIRNAGSIGFDYQRTTTTDSGGLYLDNVRVLGAGVTATGLRFTSSAGSPTPIFLWADQVISDNTVSDSIVFNNVSEVHTSKLWGAAGSGAANTTAGIKVTGGVNLRFHEPYFYHGNGGYCFLAAGGANQIQLSDVTFTGASNSRALKVTGATGVQLGRYANFTSGTFVDAAAVLSGTGSNYQSPTTFVTRGGGGSPDTVGLVDADSMGSGVWQFRNSAGTLNVLNPSFALSMLLTPGGNLAISGGFVTANGAGGQGPTVWGGSGAPATGLGNVGDFYYRSDTPSTANQRMYVKTASSTWTGIL